MTWSLIAQSFRVLSRDKKLLLFPFISALAALAVSVPFIFLALPGWADPARRRVDLVSLAIGFAWYVSASFVVIFFNCALAACAQVRFSGGEPMLADGINRAAGKVGHIFLWAVLSATVGIFLRWLSERSGLLGRIVVGIFGIGWGMATYLIVPVLVMEDVGVMEAIRRSGSLLRKTWGEQLVVGIALMWAVLLLAIPGVVLGALAMNFQPVLLILVVSYFALLAAVMTAVRGVFVVALYRYATTGIVPDGFSKDQFARRA